VVSTRLARTLFGQGNFYPLAQDGLVARDETDVGQTLLHDDGPQLSLLCLVDGIFQSLQSNTVPAICLFKGEVALQLKVQSMVGAALDPFVLFSNGAADVKLGSLWIEVQRGDTKR